VQNHSLRRPATGGASPFQLPIKILSDLSKRKMNLGDPALDASAQKGNTGLGIPRKEQSC
jgi:hypothetical protein